MNVDTTTTLVFFLLLAGMLWVLIAILEQLKKNGKNK